MKASAESNKPNTNISRISSAAAAAATTKMEGKTRRRRDAAQL